VFITFRSGREYPYNTAFVEIFQSPKIVTLENKAVLNKNDTLSGAKELHFFERYCRVVYKNGYREVFPSSNIRIIESALQTPESKNCFEYLKQIATRIGLTIDNVNILASNYEKIDIVRDDSVLAAFLHGKYENKPIESEKVVVYPFGFNQSQKKP
jgi:hypothetical protein